MSLANTSGAGRFSESLKRFIPQPENIEAQLVALDQFVIRERFELLSLLAFVARATAQAVIETNGFPIRAADVVVAFDHRFFT